MVSWESSWPQLQAAGPELAVLPVGAIEQHGPHVPVAADLIRAQELARRVAEEPDAGRQQIEETVRAIAAYVRETIAALENLAGEPVGDGRAGTPRPESNLRLVSCCALRGRVTPCPRSGSASSAPAATTPATCAG